MTILRDANHIINAILITLIFYYTGPHMLNPPLNPMSNVSSEGSLSAV